MQLSWLLDKICDLSKCQRTELCMRLGKKVDMSRFQMNEVDINVKFNEFQNCQNVHKVWFWPILVTFIFDLKFDLIDLKHPHVKFIFLQTLCIVQLFDIFDTSHIASGEYITATTAPHKQTWFPCFWSVVLKSDRTAHTYMSLHTKN